jgi:mono/diheme cytochrome c family protein
MDRSVKSEGRGWPRLCDLPALSRLGLWFLVLTLLGGYVVSGYFLKIEYEKRDERAGLTLTDIRGAYAGAVSPAPLISALEAGHPDEMGGGERLSAADRAVLLEWLGSDSIEAGYDSEDLYELPPAEIIAGSCVSCHARGATGEGAYPALPLEYWNDVQKVAISRTITPKDVRVVAASTHAHAPAMSMVLILLILLASMTRAPRWVVGVVAGVSGPALLADLSGQWLARVHGDFVYAIVAGGAISSAGVAVLGLVVMLDLVVPRGRG